MAITLAVKAELELYSDKEVLRSRQGGFCRLYEKGYPEAEEIAQEIIKESKKRHYQQRPGSGLRSRGEMKTKPITSEEIRAFSIKFTILAPGSQRGRGRPARPR